VFDSVDRKALRFKLRRKEISDKMVNCIKKIYNGIKFCVKCGNQKVINCAEKRRRVIQGCGLSPLFVYCLYR
jgi:hypothetical protein